MQSKVFLAIDYGEKRIGVALGQMIPRGMGVVVNSRDEKVAIDKIINLALQNEADAFVVGMPIRSKGEPGTNAEQIKSFSALLNERSGLPVYFEDEQFTSAESKRELMEAKADFSNKSGQIDELSAIILLEQFLSKIEKKEVKPDILND